MTELDLNRCQKCKRLFFDMMTGEELLYMNGDSYICTECRPLEVI
ncbi:hypothetical protein LCGC14_2030460 [marine sediment metagenome]|uniref:Uncharacterized protein n=1 Tax=marine sediment metagenome TaxID=412755 RepID=A0A0F9H886_9ZZZZ